MKKRVWTLVGASALAACAGFVVACGDDDGGGGGDTDAGTDGPFNPNDTGTGGDTNTQKDTGVDAGCTFAQCVIGLINTSTNATAQPDPGMCMQCKDSTSQDEFKSLFP